MFKRTFPTRTAGNGRVRDNSARSGEGQGRGSPKKFAHCKQCGFVNDTKRIDTSGGSDSGDGAVKSITKTTDTVTLLSGQTTTDTYGSANYAKGGGCACCGSKNSRS